MAHCTKCGAMVSEATSFCGSCGSPLSAAPAAAVAPAAQPGAPAGTSSGLEPHLAAAIGYIWIIAILWLVLEPYNKDRFIRFHAFQALGLGVSWFVIYVVFMIIPVVGWILLPFLGLAGFVLWLICVFNAFNKKWFKVPVIGDWAMQQAGPAQS